MNQNNGQESLFPPGRKIGTKSEYARHRACTPAAVTRALKEGRISVLKVGGRELIDFEAADSAWAVSTRPRVDAHPPPPRGPAPPPDGGSRDDLRAARLRREIAECERSERRNLHERGILVDRAEVLADLTTAAGLILNILESAADQLAPLLYEQGQEKIRAIICDHTESVCRQIAYALTAASRPSSYRPMEAASDASP